MNPSPRTPASPTFDAARNGMAMKAEMNDAELDEGLDMEQIR